MPDYDYEPPFEVGYPEEPPPVIDTSDPGNPYLPPPLPGDIGGDPVGVEGPGGSPPGLDIGSQFDWAAFAKAPAEYLSKIFGSSKNSAGVPWSEVLKGLGLSNSSGGLSMADILGLVGLLGGSAFNINQRQEASQEIKDAANKSNELIGGAVTRAQGNYAPYITAGQGALQKWASMEPSNLAGQFKAQGPTSNAAAKFHGTMSLSDLLKR